jgi:hypothetical protein
MVLNYAYSDTYFRAGGSLRLKTLYRLFASVFGQSLMGHVGLRYTILAAVSKGLFIDMTAHFEYMDLAISQLRAKLSHPETLNEGDLFGSCLLAIAGDTVPEKDLETRFVNVQGFAAILECLQQRDAKRFQCYQFLVLWALAGDLLEEMIAVNGLDFQLVEPIRKLLGPKTFNRYQRYIQILRCPEDGYKYKHKCGELWTISRLHYRELKKALRSRVLGRGECRRTVESIQPVVIDDAKRAAKCTFTVTEEIEGIMNVIGMKEILTSYGGSRLVTIYFLGLINRMMCMILEDSSIIRSLSSEEVAQEAIRIASWMRSYGGDIFFDFDVFKRPQFSELPFEDIVFWWRVAEKAGNKFLDGVHGYYPC